MIKEETINGKVFIEQTTYFIYNSEEDRQNSLPLIVTGIQELFEEKKRAELRPPERESFGGLQVDV